MNNEILFFLQISAVSIGALLCTRLKEQGLIAYISLLFIMANIFVIKQISLFGLCVTSTDAFIVGISMSCNFLQELYGKESARTAVRISFVLCILYMIIAKIIVAFDPAPCDQMHHLFTQITTHTTRITLASLAAYFLTQMLDIYLYSLIKKLTNGRFFVLRNYFSIALSQLTDTVLFSFAGLYGIVDNIFDVMIFSFIIKIMAIAATTPFLMTARHFFISNHNHQ